jgi:glycosyltransferase involved in cell wall biosynthesis
MRLLHLIATVDPASGGPVESVRRGGIELRALGHEVEVASLDAPDAPHAAGFELPLHALGPARGTYGWTPRLAPWLRRAGPRYDAAIVNGLWQYPGLAARVALRPLGIPYFVFTHGMLDPWFRRTYPLKHAKKWLYWPWAEYRVLRDASAVLFTCEEERRLARESFWLYRAREHVVAFGTSAPPPEGDVLAAAFRARRPELRDRRVLLFLGRLHPKKGCDLLVDAFARLAPTAPDHVLVMAGPDQEGWRATLESRAAAAGVADRIVWAGMLHGDEKWGALYASEALVLPSHQENFGIVVAEALGCGVPALVSDRVNIWREIESDGAGLVAADDAAGTESLLKRWLALDAEARSALSAAARECYRRRFTARAMASSLVAAIEPHLRSAPRSPPASRPRAA